MEEKIEELTRRIDNLTTQLHAGDSEYGLHQIPELKKKLEGLAILTLMNDNELRILRDSVLGLQKAKYSKIEKASLSEMKKLFKIIFDTKRS
jgi:hypothetical protein